MDILSWLIVGGIAGLLAQFLFGSNSNLGLGANIIFGILGAIIGSYALRSFSIGAVTGLDVWSIIVATFGAITLLLIMNTLMKK